MSGLEGLSIVANLFRVMGFAWEIVKELKNVSHGVGELLEGNSQHLKIRDSLRKSLNVLSIKDATKNKNIKNGETSGEKTNGGKTNGEKANGKETNGEKANDQSTKDEEFKGEEDLEDVAGVLKKFLNDADSKMQRLVVRTSDRHQFPQYARSSARTTLRRNKIDEVERNLKKAQEGVDTRLLAMMKWNENLEFFKKLDENRRLDNEIHFKASADLFKTANEILKAIEAKATDNGAIAQLFKKLMEENKKANRILDVLRHLRDDLFTTRFNNIESAHERTFDCIFQDYKLEFSRGLEHEGNSFIDLGPVLRQEVESWKTELEKVITTQ
ncbi:uncharacterized protein IWZ02DRAFT_486301 [Phyllosticta citriasiana]|uniref:uncharacterized protein n=1 Tax=Phyllosticta citriasiana TaxID=595635 RepID=UPI0030FD2E5A